MRTKSKNAFTGAVAVLLMFAGVGAAEASTSDTAVVLPLQGEHDEAAVDPEQTEDDHDYHSEDAAKDEMALYGHEHVDKVTADGHDHRLDEEKQPIARALVAGAASVPPSVSIDRTSGSDRYESSVEMSRQSHPGGAPIVYVASGEDFPDALSAAAAASKDGGPLLLTRNGALPDAVRNEVVRLKPQSIVVVGGPGAISAAVFDALNRLKPAERISGVDRYETSVRVSNFAFGRSSSDTAYIATGTDFPDALSAGGAAGARNAPVILVQGPAPSVGNLTINSLKNMGVKNVKIAGGDAVVSPGIAKQFGRDFQVSRIFGDDRFETSQRVNADTFIGTDRVFLATGHGFADALAGSAYAGSSGSPLYIARTNCVPSDILTAISDLEASQITLLGGPGALGTGVEQLIPCPEASRSEYIFPSITRYVSDDFAEHVARNSVNPGTDYTCAVGQSIVAVKPGRVSYAQSTYAGSGGRLVYLDHGDGTVTDYLHLSRTDVVTGQYVAQGQRIGISGGSAWGSESGVGAHLHIALKMRGVNVDFERYVR